MLGLRNKQTILVASLIACLAFFLACDESLPPRNDPSRLFRGSADTKYSLLWNENALRIGVNIVNIYDETIQTSVNMVGTLKVTLVRNKTYEKTINLNVSNLVKTKSYNSSTNELTLDPGDSIRFIYTWNFVDDHDVNLPLDVFHYDADVSCPGRFLAHSESFLISGSFQIIEKLGTFPLDPVVFSLCYVSKYMSAHDCPAPPTECSR
jgi:hypothetical protein